MAQSGTGALDHKQPPVGGTSLGLQLVKVAQAALHAEVVR